MQMLQEPLLLSSNFIIWIYGIAYFSVCSSLLPVVLWFRRKARPSLINFIGALSILSILSDTISYIVIYFGAANNNMVLNIFFYGQCVLLSLFYYLSGFSSKKHIILLTTAFVILCLSEILFGQSIESYQSHVHVIGSIILIGYSINCYRMMIRDIDYQSWTKHKSLFYINSAIFFYFSYMAFFVLNDFLLAELNIQSPMVHWSLHNVSNIIKNVLFAVGIFYSKEEKMSSVRATN
jgi:hypothetical protein